MADTKSFADFVCYYVFGDDGFGIIIPVLPFYAKDLGLHRLSLVFDGHLFHNPINFCAHVEENFDRIDANRLF